MGVSGSPVGYVALEARVGKDHPIRIIRRVNEALASFAPWGEAKEDDLPMWRRDLSSPSFVDAMVSRCGKSGGFLDRIKQASTGRRSRPRLSPIHASPRGAPG
jgi:hypothetical protein